MVIVKRIILFCILLSFALVYFDEEIFSSDIELKGNCVEKIDVGGFSLDSAFLIPYVFQKELIRNVSCKRRSVCKSGNCFNLDLKSDLSNLYQDGYFMLLDTLHSSSIPLLHWSPFLGDVNINSSDNDEHKIMFTLMLLSPIDSSYREYNFLEFELELSSSNYLIKCTNVNGFQKELFNKSLLCELNSKLKYLETVEELNLYSNFLEIELYHYQLFYAILSGEKAFSDEFYKIHSLLTNSYFLGAYSHEVKKMNIVMFLLGV